jgi:hypothetical protein
LITQTSDAASASASGDRARSNHQLSAKQTRIETPPTSA